MKQPGIPNILLGISAICLLSLFLTPCKSWGLFEYLQLGWPVLAFILIIAPQSKNNSLPCMAIGGALLSVLLDLWLLMLYLNQSC